MIELPVEVQTDPVWKSLCEQINAHFAQHDLALMATNVRVTDNRRDIDFVDEKRLQLVRSLDRSIAGRLRIIRTWEKTK